MFLKFTQYILNDKFILLFNCLEIKMKPDDFVERERKVTETLSETSECTTTATNVSGHQGFDSQEELIQLAALLQINNFDDVYRERFRVDRQKLEHMLLGNY